MAQQIRKGHGLAALILGIIELVIALIVVICSFVLAGKADNIPKTLTPYWAGIPFIIPGILGIVTGVTKNKCSMIAFMVLNIICFVLQGIATILLGIVVAVYAAYASNINVNCHATMTGCVCRSSDGTPFSFNGIKDCNVVSTISTMLYVITILLVIGAITTLASSIVGCASVCCSGGQPQTIIVQQPGMVMHQNEPPAYK